MSEKTKIVVIHMKELLYTAIFTALVIILIVVLVFMFLPEKEEGEEHIPIPTVSTTQMPEVTSNVIEVD